MKRHLWPLSTAALLLSAATLISCSGKDIVVTENTTTGSTPNQTSISTGTVYAPPATTTPNTTERAPTTNSVPRFTPGYQEIVDFDAYKKDHVNLTKLYFDGVVTDHTVFPEIEFYVPGQNVPNLFDCDPETVWQVKVEAFAGVSAVVWSMTESVYVTAYSITTGRYATTYIKQNPISWRLYATNELPDALMSDLMPGSEISYLASGSEVPEGWVLIDTVDAKNPYSEDPDSIIPNWNSYEAGIEVDNPGSYKYFMLLIDESEEVVMELADFTLYGILPDTAD